MIGQLNPCVGCGHGVTYHLDALGVLGHCSMLMRGTVGGQVNFLCACKGMIYDQTAGSIRAGRRWEDHVVRQRRPARGVA